MMNKPEWVRDEHQREYKLGQLLGRGGQGQVFRVRDDKRLAVKLLNDKNSPRRRDKLRNQLTSVKRMPLQDMHIARPAAMLAEPHLGYVMELLTGMTPIKTLMTPPQQKSIAEWYLQNGGLRRRLRLLAKAANLLAQIHGKGLVYGDPSPGNIFVSEDAAFREVWLIDPDNLRYQSSPSDEAVYTPEYGAPELVRGRSGVNTLSDAHAFAVIAFKTLALVHPLLGDYVNNGEPELEEQAFCGELPWVDHRENDLNRASVGIPREMALSPRLQDLARRTFEEGLNDPQKRPGLMEWTEKLAAAADMTLHCPDCGGAYYCKSLECTWCDHPRPGFAILRMLLQDKETQKIIQKNKREQIIASIMISEGESQILTDRFLHGKDSEAPRIHIELNKRLLTLQSMDDKQYRLLASSGEEMLGARPRTLHLLPGNRYQLHLGSSDQLHRLICFDCREEGA
ncbi:MAG: serine/threonine protein kinase [Gammaproteobacteria bacterium]|nr:serine/threonine protein kinase [Gammaproteobacteria bacterium]